MRTARARLIVVTGLVLALLLGACSSTDDGVTSVTIDGGDRSVEVGGALTLTATVVASGSASDATTWDSSDQAIATIDAAGNALGLAVGTTTLTATSTADASKRATITLTITAASSVVSVTIAGGDRSVAVGGALTLTATVVTTGSASEAVSWSSSTEGVATITAAGGVSGLAVGTTTLTATSTADASKRATITLTVYQPGVLRWTRQFGTAGDDLAFGIATDANGNLYTAGVTDGALEGPSAGADDAFIRSYDSAGTLRWTRQFGTDRIDGATGIATDASGNVYAAGITDGALEGPSAGGADAFIRSYDSAGTVRWTRQFGSTTEDLRISVATDGIGNVYAAGDTYGALEGSSAGDIDTFIRSYDASGAVRWTRQFGTDTTEYTAGVAADATGNVYVVGSTFGVLDGFNAGFHDAYVRSYDSAGTHRWTRQFGNPINAYADDAANGVAVDASGNVYVVGTTAASLAGTSAGGDDVFVRSYDSAGTHRWTRQFGTAGADVATGVTADASGTTYVAGHTDGALAGASAGSRDAFLRAYDSAGNLLWTRQFGTSSSDVATGVAADASGNACVTGYTDGALEGASAGTGDTFVRTYGP